MSMNIKSAQAHATAAQLARLTGESLTQAVQTSLELRLQQELAKRAKPKAERILEFAARFAPGIDPALRSNHHADLLYGADGLPL
jgi:hypothetical protein